MDNPFIPNRPGSDGVDLGALEVNHILYLTGVVRVGANMHVQFTTDSDKSYALEFKPNVSGPSWTILPESIPGTGGIVTATNHGAGLLPVGFYRAFQQ